jgi:hypothetical protein
MEHVEIELLGKFTKYAVLVAEQGYCFYDVDDEQRYYMTKITTPITDIEELKRKYVVIYGNAEKLNEENEEWPISEE